MKDRYEGPQPLALDYDVGSRETFRLRRPFIERLFAAGDYNGEIRNASERKRLEVKADEFLAWIKECSDAADPGDLAQIRTEAIVDDDSPPTEKSTPELRAASRARALELARKLGQRR